MMTSKPRLYDEFASWLPILSAPEDYTQEAIFYHKVMTTASAIPIGTVLEMGCGSGNNASHLKKHFRMTLVDIAPKILVVSQGLNPECEHIEGDMRTVRLGRLFDSVFIQDAISYMATFDDLKATIETAFIHCKEGGVALFIPDYTKENFRPGTSHGGHDTNDRSLRYLEWTSDPDPDDNGYIVDFAYLLRNPSNQVTAEYDHHELGLFSRVDWLRIIQEAGFEPQVIPFEHCESEPGMGEIFIGKKPS
jgi:SAM-dependent methyltransferase